MKKTASLIMASALIICSFASCTDNSKAIIGKWEMKELSDTDIKVGGLEFKENGKGSMYMDTTNILHADGKSLVVGSGEQAVKFEEDLIEYDGKNFNINLQGQYILSLEKVSGGESTDSYDGEYKLKSGVMHDSIVGNITKNADDTVNGDVSLFISFDGSSSEVTFVDIFDYKVNKNKLELSGYASFIGDSADGKPVSADVEIKDDVMTITSSENEKEELVKVK